MVLSNIQSVIGLRHQGILDYSYRAHQVRQVNSPQSDPRGNLFEKGAGYANVPQRCLL